jgi:uncharacterized protein (TIGR02145 family)
MSKRHTLYTVLFVFLCVVFFSCRKDEVPEYIIERGTVMDVDSNVYQTVKIGDQWWMAENLIVTKFNDSTSIAIIHVDSIDSWAATENPAYCVGPKSGNLYNAYVVNSEKNIAPKGWHVPTDEEWKELEREIGMLAEEADYSGWRGVLEANALASKYRDGWGASTSDQDLYGTDYYGFNAIPSSVRGYNGRLSPSVAQSLWWWTKTSTGTENYYRSIDSDHTEIFRHATVHAYGMSIRCIKD